MFWFLDKTSLKIYFANYQSYSILFNFIKYLSNRFSTPIKDVFFTWTIKKTSH